MPATSRPSPTTASGAPTWARLAQRGALESGAPLQPIAKAVSSGSVDDAKLGTPDIYGYMVVNADSVDDAIAIARQAPHMALGGSTIVRPCVELPG
jgi:hypothetical protein